MNDIQNNLGNGEVRLLTIKEVASILALGRSKVYELVLRGEIPSVKITRSRRVPSDVLQKYITELSVSS
jgi:excisionase family DNA binding protein